MVYLSYRKGKGHNPNTLTERKVKSMENYTYVRMQWDIKFRLKLITIWDIERVRAYCIKHNYCDMANTTQYDEMLGFVGANPYNERNALQVVNFIYEHSTEFESFKTSGYKKENLLELLNEFHSEATFDYYIDIEEDETEE